MNIQISSIREPFGICLQVALEMQPSFWTPIEHVFVERSECSEQLSKQKVSAVVRARVRPDAVAGDRHMPVEIDSYGQYVVGRRTVIIRGARNRGAPRLP